MFVKVTFMKAGIRAGKTGDKGIHLSITLFTAYITLFAFHSILMFMLYLPSSIAKSLFPMSLHHVMLGKCCAVTRGLSPTSSRISSSYIPQNSFSRSALVDVGNGTHRHRYRWPR